MRFWEWSHTCMDHQTLNRPWGSCKYVSAPISSDACGGRQWQDVFKTNCKLIVNNSCPSCRKFNWLDILGWSVHPQLVLVSTNPNPIVEQVGYFYSCIHRHCPHYICKCHDSLKWILKTMIKKTAPVSYGKRINKKTAMNNLMDSIVSTSHQS